MTIGDRHRRQSVRQLLTHLGETVRALLHRRRFRYRANCRSESYQNDHLHQSAQMQTLETTKLIHYVKSNKRAKIFFFSKNNSNSQIYIVYLCSLANVYTHGKNIMVLSISALKLLKQSKILKNLALGMKVKDA